ncbi:hypothetical protein CH275_16525 [Rhodococcus sp. 06-235-1A]|uniref:transaldolase family protein n=1 Tax=Rhodococcus sp. 06-235-1A TaxID=2022508 RepID=UPI000B9A7C7F|nr:transaldolase family protein [Rhodococcus sp. 06-235-1A]OZD03383.1 hypothetical protein CH275_16525 [Rhodococcus sp. 06-235-1A]
MQIFLDTTDLDAIREWLPHGLIDGVTTNPTLLARSGNTNRRECAADLAALVAPRDVSVQVQHSDPAAMADDARQLAEIASNIVVKIPVISESGRPNLDTIATLTEEKIPVNATACLSLAQVVSVAKAGARYASLLWGRAADEGADAGTLVSEAVGLLEHYNFPTKVLVGSVRSAGDLTGALRARADVVTVPPSVLSRWLDHHYSRATVAQFQIDAKNVQ